jgi:hypothetical protein
LNRANGLPIVAPQQQERTAQYLAQIKITRAKGADEIPAPNKNKNGALLDREDCHRKGQ